MTQTHKYQLTKHNSSHLYGRAKSQPNTANVNPQNTISLFTHSDCFNSTANSPESQVDMKAVIPVKNFVQLSHSAQSKRFNYAINYHWSSA